MSHVAGSILHLHGWTALVVIFGLPALESSAFVGFLFPGEIAVLLGGVLAYQHRVSLAAVIAAAVLGAVIGDTIGFEIGKRWGRRLLHGTIGRVVKHEHLDRAENYLKERGGKAVFFGRFTAALRVLIPGLAGMSGMPYGTFAAYNIVGGVTWATGFVLLGYAAGTSYHQVEHYAKEASLLLLVIALVVALIVGTARRVARHRDRIHRFLDRQASRPRISRIRDRYRHQLDFLVRRFDRRSAIGLTLTVTLAALVLAGWAFGALVTDLVFDRQLIGPDHATLRFMVAHRTDWLTTFLRALTALGSSLTLLPLSVAAAAAWRWRKGNWLAAWLLATTYGGATLSFNLIKRLTHRPRPATRFGLVHAGGYAFPSGHATQAAAIWGALAFLAALTLTTWPRKVAAWTIAVIITGVVGLTRIYLGVHWLSDVAAGWTLGGVWLFAVLAVRHYLHASKAEPAPPKAPARTTTLNPDRTGGRSRMKP